MTKGLLEVERSLLELWQSDRGFARASQTLVCRPHWDPPVSAEG